MLYPYATPEDVIKFDLWLDKNEMGIRLGSTLISGVVSSTPEQYYINTNTEKQKAYNFIFKGLDTDRREIRLSFRYNISKYSPSGESGTENITNYDKTYEINAAIWLGYSKGRFTSMSLVEKLPPSISDDISELFKVQVSGIMLSIMSILNGKEPAKLRNILLSAGLEKRTISVTMKTLEDQLRCVSRYYDAGIIYEKDIRFDADGIWFIYGFEPPSIERIRALVENASC